jgi:hypothetical protein
MAALNRFLDRMLAASLVVFAGLTLAYWLAVLGLLAPVLVLPIGLLASIPVAAWVARTFPETADGEWSPRELRRGTVLVLVAAATAAALSVLVIRPDADDYFYVNKSRWVAEQGTLAIRDTIFGPQIYATDASYLVNSYETLIGLAAKSLAVDPTTLTYVVVPPLATAAATWTLWLLLRSWRLRQVDLAFAVAFAGLMLGAVTHAAAANLFVGRMWQGKGLFLAIVVPFVWSCAPAGRRGHAALVAACVVGVGLTSSALVVLPPILLVAVAACVLVERRVAWIPLLSAAGLVVTYGVLAGTRTGKGSDAPLIELTALGVVQKSFGTGIVAALSVLAVLVGPLAVSDRLRRSALLLAVAGLAVALSPPVLDLLSLSSGAAVAWRMVWWVPAAALLGAAVVIPWLSRRASWGAAAAMLLVLLVAGTPVWSAANGSRLTAAVEWKLPVGIRDQASALSQLPDGSIVLAPSWTSIGVAVSSSDVYTITGRPDYTAERREDEAFQADRREFLTAFVSGQSVAVSDLGEALAGVGVTHVCLSPDAPQQELLEQLDWRVETRPPSLVCWVPES